MIHLSYKMHMNINVLGLFPMNLFPWDMDGTLIVTKDDSMLELLNSKLGENVMQPDGFDCYIYIPQQSKDKW